MPDDVSVKLLPYSYCCYLHTSTITMCECPCECVCVCVCVCSVMTRWLTCWLNKLISHTSTSVRYDGHHHDYAFILRYDNAVFVDSVMFDCQVCCQLMLLFVLPSLHRLVLHLFSICM